MIAKEDAIKKGLDYAATRLGISGNTSVAEPDGQTGNWIVSIIGKQEEELLMVTVQVTVKVYESNGETKCQLLMPPTKSEYVEQIDRPEFFPDSLPEKPQESPKQELGNMFPD